MIYLIGFRAAWAACLDLLWKALLTWLFVLLRHKSSYSLSICLWDLFLAIYPKNINTKPIHMVRQARRKSEASTHPSGWAVLHMAWEGRLKCFHNNEAVLHFIYVVLGSLQIRHIIIYPADNAEWRFCIEVPTAPERRTTRIKKLQIMPNI